MAGRAGYSDLLAMLAPQELEAAIATLPDRSRKLLQRTEIERAPHKIVAAELRLSMRQFYRERTAAVRAAFTRAASPDGTRPEPLRRLPTAVRMSFVRISNAIHECNVPRLDLELEALRVIRNALSSDVLPDADVMLAIGEAAAARVNGDPERAISRLRDVAQCFKDLDIRSRVTRSAAYALSAVLSLANELLNRGDTDMAVALADDALLIAVDVSDNRLQIEAEIVLANAYLAFPCHVEDAHMRATAVVRRCSGTKKSTLLIRSLRVLASSFAELGRDANALSLRDVVHPLGSTTRSCEERLEYLTWCAGLELQCGSAARAADLAESARRQMRTTSGIGISTSIVRAGALFSLGSYAQSIQVARDAYIASESSGRPRLIGEAALMYARGAYAMSDHGKARTLIQMALPLLDRSALVSVQTSAYSLSYKLTKNPLHGFLANAYRPGAESRGQ